MRTCRLYHVIVKDSGVRYSSFISQTLADVSLTSQIKFGKQTPKGDGTHAQRIVGKRCKKTSWRIREIPDHATFRQKGVNTGLVRQTWGLSLFGPM